MTILLDFDHFGSGSSLTYAEDGFVVRDVFGDPYGRNFHLFAPYIPYTPGMPRPHPGYIAGVEPQVTRADGGRFSLTQIDLDNEEGLATLTGFKADGSVVRFSAPIDTAPGFQTIVLPSTFTDLVSLTIRGRGGDLFDYRENPFISPYFDNLVLTVPSALYGSTAGDTLNGAAGSDDLFGYGGADTLNGGDGNDWLDGGQGDDLMIGGAGDDLYFITSRGDRVVETANNGNDMVRSGITWVLGDNVENLELLYTGDADGFGNALNNRMIGNSGANVLRGFGGDDRLFGGDGNDTLEGGWGADVLASGFGVDVLSGGGGADLFLFQRDELGIGGLLATITDFNHNQGDKMQVQYNLLVNHFIGSDPFSGDPSDIEFGEGPSAGHFRYQAITGGVQLEGDINGDGLADWTIKLLGVTSLQASDFVF